MEGAFSLDNWCHFRDMESQQKKDLVSRNEAIYNDDFLDCVAEDSPKCSWSIIPDATKTVATLRSQLWPGYYAYHRVKTPIHGAVYIGDGMPNINLPFML
jgi:radial spoke head protein 9